MERAGDTFVVSSCGDHADGWERRTRFELLQQAKELRHLFHEVLLLLEHLTNCLVGGGSLQVARFEQSQPCLAEPSICQEIVRAMSRLGLTVPSLNP